MPVANSIVSVGLLLASGPALALAHEGGTMGVALANGRLPPGAGVEIIGIDFSPEETIVVRLEGSGGRWTLGTLTAGSDGHFAVVLPVPSDVPPGVYSLDVVSSAGITFRELLQIDPAAPAPATTITPQEMRIEPADAGAADVVWQLAPLLVLAAAIGGLLVIVARRRHRSHRGRGGVDLTQR